MSDRQAIIYRETANEYYMACFNGISLKEELSSLYQEPRMAHELMLLLMQNVEGRCLNWSLPNMDDIGTDIEQTGKMCTSRANYPPLKFSSIEEVNDWLTNENYWSACEAFLYDSYSGKNRWYVQMWFLSDAERDPDCPVTKLFYTLLDGQIENDFVEMSLDVLRPFLESEIDCYEKEWLKDTDFMAECDMTPESLSSDVERFRKDINDWENLLEETANMNTDALFGYIREAREFSAIPDNLRDAFKLAEHAR